MLKFLSKNTYEKELAKLKKLHPEESSKSFKELKLELDFKYNKIDEYTKLKGLIELEYDSDDKEKRIKLLALDKKFNKIDDLEYEKQMNDIDQNPWAKIHFNYDENNDPDNMQTEIVYNDYFIKKLQSQGYSGNSNDDIIQSWLSQVFASNVEPGDLDLEGDRPEYIKKKKVKNTFIVG